MGTIKNITAKQAARRYGVSQAWLAMRRREKIKPDFSQEVTGWKRIWYSVEETDIWFDERKKLNVMRKQKNRPKKYKKRMVQPKIIAKPKSDKYLSTAVVGIAVGAILACAAIGIYTIVTSVF